jgi:hypothetical protein
MKKMLFVSVVAFLAIVFATATAAAQTTVAPKQIIRTVACKGDGEACFNLEIYQKMAVTAGSAAAPQAQASTGASAANNPVTERRTRAAGGVENNPTEDGGGSVQLTLQKNADRQNGGVQATQRTKGANAPANNPVTERRTRAAGGVENNPAEDGGGSVQLTLQKNADRQRDLTATARTDRAGQNGRTRLAPRGGDPTGNNPAVEGAPAMPTGTAADRAMNRFRPRAGEAKALQAIRTREASRVNPSDF